MTTAHPTSMRKKLKDLQKKYGDENLCYFGDVGRSHLIRRFTTGSFNLNQAIGGGWPEGRIIELLGEESSGKTTWALKACGAIQKKGKVAAFIDLEHALDPVWARKLGVSMDDILWATPNTAEEALDLVTDLCQVEEIGLVVLDSVAALVPRAELEGNVEDANVAVVARYMSKTLRKLVGIAQENNTTMLFTNQTRDTIGGGFSGPGYTTTGGKALKFYASIRLLCTRSTKLLKDGVAIGNVMKVYVLKNKTAPPFQRAQTNVYFDRGFDESEEIVEFYLNRQLIMKRKAHYTLPTRQDLDDILGGKYEPRLEVVIDSVQENRIKVHGLAALNKSVGRNENFAKYLPKFITFFAKLDNQQP